MSLTLDRQTVRLHRLSFLAEDGEYIVGRTDIDSYGVFPPDGAALVQELGAGRTIGEAADWYRLTYGQPVDMGEFLATLGELDFLLDDGALGEPALENSSPVRWQRLGRALFSPAAWLAYGLLVVSAVAVCLADPRLAPRASNVFFTDYRLIIELSILFGQIPLTLLHEVFHVLAGRRLGLRSRLRLSHRFYFLVFETALDGLVAIPRRKRYLPMLAGMVADVLVIATLTLVAAATRLPSGEPSLLGRLCLAFAFTTLLRIAWQFYFYLRTDVYYLITTVLGCVDLQRTTREFLRNRVRRLLGRTGGLTDESQWHPRDRRTVRWYGPLAVAGYGISTAMLVVVFIPLTWRFLGEAVRAVFAGGGGSASRLWDAAAVLTLTLGQLVLAAALALRERRRAATPDRSKGD